MKLIVRYFAAVREDLGGEEVCSWAIEADAPRTVGELLEQLRSKSAAHEQALGRSGLRMALNHDLCDAGATLSDGAEVAFFPPVTGG